MEWQQLEYFYVVGHMEHMTAAAQRLSVTQPAMSRAISRLEKELGVPLFERQGRSIVLNRYGRRFLKRVDNMMREYEEGREELQRMLDPEAGEVSLGFLHTMGMSVIPDLLRGFRERHPQIRVKLSQNTTTSLLEQLAEGGIDICMIASPGAAEQFRWAHLWTEELFVAVPAGHGLADRNSIRLEEIRDEPLITFKKGYGLRTIADNLLKEAGITPSIVFEGDEVHTVAGLTASGLGVSLIPGVQGLDENRLRLLPVDHPPCRRQMGVAWVEDRYMPPTAGLFLRFVLEMFDKTGSVGSI
ncbi:putative HTH-type transcriptional regulator YybE [Cohnella xylanilytica]|uniref:LysR family transcriptional regulator n=1 Tax=Cohnella TaxID=329857 RepID=UPI0009BA70C1|nr:MULTISPECIES: LysR family transcriptional regulator [Cohnella]GIO15889.1 putative HTH-type transcriptional regulator YybE [Cohnella xylanilytica]